MADKTNRHTKSATMHLTCQFVICLAAAVVSGQHLAAVTLTLSYEGRKDFMIDFKFTSALFQSFYQCMCKAETQLCSLIYDVSSYEIQRVQLNSTSPPAPSQCKMYACTNSAQASRVICRTLGQAQACATGVKSTFWGLDLPSSCSTSCVGIAWSLTEEKLTVNDPQLQVHQCDNPCCSGVASVQPPPQNNSSTERLEIFVDAHDGSYTDTYVVGGIAAGVVFIAIVVFVTCLVLKRRTGPSTGQREATSETQSSTNGIHHSLYPNKTVINGNQAHGGVAGQDAGKQLQATNLFAGLGLANARHTPGHEHMNIKSDDIRNKPVHNKNNNKNKASKKGFFKRKSNTPAGVNDEVANDTPDDNTFEGDYAEIDDSQIQDSNPLDYTPDSNETDLNDGYSSVDNSDYYNINGITLSTADDNIGKSQEGSRDVYTPKEASSIMDSKAGVKADHHQHSDISVLHGNVSEYSIAKGIIEEVPAHSMGQQMDRQSIDPNFRPEQDQGNTSDSDDEDRKRHSYFILEKQLEEEDI